MCRGFRLVGSALALATISSKVRRGFCPMVGSALPVFSRSVAAQLLLQHFPQPRAILRVSAWKSRPQFSQIFVISAIVNRVFVVFRTRRGIRSLVLFRLRLSPGLFLSAELALFRGLSRFLWLSTFAGLRVAGCGSIRVVPPGALLLCRKIV